MITPIIKCGMKLLIHFQTSTVQLLMFGMDKWFHTTLYWAPDYLSMLGLKLIHVSKRALFSDKALPEPCELLLSGKKTLTEQILTQFCVTIWRHWAIVS